MKSAIRIGLLVALALLEACASTPKTYMLVPSREVVPQLESLSHQAGTTVNVLTAQLAQSTLRLDGRGGGALTGTAVGEEATQRVAFDDAALVYYSKGDVLATDKFPILAPVGAAEQQLECNALKVELGRTEAIRWLARQHGGLPFTAHEAAVQHGKNALKDVGMVALVAVVIVGCSAGGCGGGLFGGSYQSPPPAVSVEAYRWAVTRADQREIGLLGFSRDKQCAARLTGTELVTDREVLEHIEESSQQLGAHVITDRQQMDLQTQWLDRLYGAQAPVAAKLPEIGSDGMTGRDIVGVSWAENQDAEEHPSSAISHFGRRGQLALRADAMTFSAEDSWNPSRQIVTVQFADLTDAVVAHFGKWRGVVVTYKSGRKDTLMFSRGMLVDRDLAVQVCSWLKAKTDSAIQP